MSQAISARDVAPGDALPATRKKSRSLRTVLMGGGLVVVAVGSLAFWLMGGRTVSIDNAYVRSDKLSIATDVSGIIDTIPVHEGETVKAGQVLFQLQQRKFQIALQSAKADLAQTALSLEADKRDYQRMLKDVATKQAMLDADTARYNRVSGLVGRGDVSRQQFDDARFQLAGDQMALASSKGSSDVLLARLNGNPDVDVTTLPAYLKAQAAVEEAQRQLDHATVRAPLDGIVTGVPNAQPGLYLGASDAAFGLVSTENMWIEANPKETELTHVKPGDAVDISVDTYPGRDWKGVVESIAPASGSTFSILPAQNSSGNWVKVVQRISVRIKLLPTQDAPVLRSGMSVEATIDTGHKRSLSDLF